MQVFYYILLFFIYSFLGWCLETMVNLFNSHKFVNRGFLVGPYCPIYGCGAVLMTIFLEKYLDDPITLFILIILICSVLEYLTSYILEKLFNTRWWDYTTYKFNINGRICLETMIPFGIFGLIIMYQATPFFLNIITKINPNIIIFLAIFLILILIIDIIISSKTIFEIQKINKNIQRKIIIKKDDTERITKLVKKKIKESRKLLHQRIINAFPNLKILISSKRTIKKNTKRS